MVNPGNIGRAGQQRQGGIAHIKNKRQRDRAIQQMLANMTPAERAEYERRNRSWWQRLTGR